MNPTPPTGPDSGTREGNASHASAGSRERAQPQLLAASPVAFVVQASLPAPPSGQRLSRSLCRR